MDKPHVSGETFPAIIRRITTTDEGRVQILIDAQTDEVSVVQSLFDMQRRGVIVGIEPAQRELFDDDEISPAEAPSRAR